MNETNLMSKMKISKAVATMAIPSVISSLVTVVYNMADTFFVGQTGDPLQVAAVSLTNPIFILFMAFAICLEWEEVRQHPLLWVKKMKNV